MPENIKPKNTKYKSSSEYTSELKTSGLYPEPTNYGESNYDDITISPALTQEEVDERRSENQGFVDKLGNAFAQGVTTAGTSFAGGTVGLANGVLDMMSGKSFFENDTFKILDEIDKESKEAFPLYRSRTEMEGSFTDRVLSDDFFLDSLFNGLGFVAGGWGSGALYAKAVGKGLQLLKLGQSDKVVKLASELGIENPQGFATTLSKVAQKVPNITAATTGRVYESALEANQVYEQLQEKIARGEITEAEAKQLRNSVFGTNMLLALPEYYQYTKFLDNFSNKRATLNAIRNEGGQFVQDKLTGKKALISDLGQLGFQTGTEGLEEGYQYIASKAGESGNESYIDAFVDSTLQSLSDPDFYASMVAGSLIGGTMGTVGTIKGGSESKQRNEYTQKVVDLMNKHLPDYSNTFDVAKNKLNSFYTLEKEKSAIIEALNNEEDPGKIAVLKDEYRKRDHEQLTNFVQATAESNTFDDRLDDLNVLLQADDETISAVTGIVENKKDNGIEKTPTQVLRERIKKLKDYKKTYDKVAGTYLNSDLTEVGNKFKAQALYEFANEKENIVTNKIIQANSSPQISDDYVKSLEQERLYYQNLQKEAILQYNNVPFTKEAKTTTKTPPITITKEDADFINNVFTSKEPVEEETVPVKEEQPSPTAGVFTPTNRYGKPTGDPLTTATEETPAPVSTEVKAEVEIVSSVEKLKNQNQVFQSPSGKFGVLSAKDNETIIWSDTLEQAKYNAELDALEGKPTTNIKTDINEVLNDLGNKEFNFKVKGETETRTGKKKNLGSTVTISQNNAPLIADFSTIEKIEDLDGNVLYEAADKTVPKIVPQEKLITGDDINKSIDIDDSNENNFERLLKLFKSKNIAIDRSVLSIFNVIVKAINKQLQSGKIGNRPVLTLDYFNFLDLRDPNNLLLANEVIKRYNGFYGFVTLSVDESEKEFNKKIEAIDIEESNEKVSESISDKLVSGLSSSYKIVQTKPNDNRKTLYDSQGRVVFIDNPLYDSFHTNEILVGEEWEITIENKNGVSESATTDEELDKMVLVLQKRNPVTGTYENRGYVHNIGYVVSDNIAENADIEAEKTKIRNIRKHFLTNDSSLKVKVVNIGNAKLEFNKNTFPIEEDMLKNIYVYINGRYQGIQQFDGTLIPTEKEDLNGRIYLLAPQASHSSTIDQKFISVDVTTNNFSGSRKVGQEKINEKAIAEIRENIKNELLNYFQTGTVPQDGWVEKFLFLNRSNSKNPITSKKELRVSKSGNRVIETSDKLINDKTPNIDEELNSILNNILFNLNVKALRDNSLLPNSQFTYQQMIIEAGLIETNLATKMTNNGRLYAFQPTFYYELENNLSEEINEKQKEINKIVIDNKNLGKSVLQKLGYKNQNRFSNGNVKGGQSGWKIRFNIKNSKTGKSYYSKSGKPLIDSEYKQKAEKLATFLDNYFQTDSKEYNKKNNTEYGKDSVGFRKGTTSSIWKHLHGGEIGESDFTIYIGSADDVLKFISDVRTKHPEIIELLDKGNISDDILIDDIFKGRIEGKDIGFKGYGAPESLNEINNEEEFNFIYNGEVVTIQPDKKYGGVLIFIEENKNGKKQYKAYNGVGDNDLKNNYPDLYKNIRNIIGFQLYNSYLKGSNDEFVKITNIEQVFEAAEENPIAKANTNALLDALGELGVEIPNSEESNLSIAIDSSIDVESETNDIINNNITLEEEFAIIDSIASQLINTKEEDLKEAFKKSIVVLQQGLQEKNLENRNQLEKLLENRQILFDNFDKYISKAKNVLEKLNFQQNEEGVYETFADSEDNVEQYLDESSAKENRLDSMYAEIRKMLSFIPDYNLKGNKKINSVGLPYFIPVDFVFTQIVEELFSGYYTNTIASYEIMLDKLRNSSSYYLKHVASILDESTNDQIKRQFYQVFSAEKENPITISVEGTGTDIVLYENEADNSTGANLIVGEFIQKMYDSPNLSRVEFVEGVLAHSINKNYINNVKERLETFISNSQNFNKSGNIITIADSNIQELVEIFNSLGINIDSVGVKQYLQKREESGFKGAVRNDQKFLKEVVLDLLIEKGYLQTNTLEDLVINEGSILNSLSKAILLTSTRAIAGTYRVAGTQYSSFTKSKPVTEKINWLKTIWSTLENSHVYKYLSPKLKNIKIIVDRGFKYKKKSDPRFYKDTNPIEFEIIKVLTSQIINKNKDNTGYIKSETLSDKSTNLMFKNIMPNIKNVLEFNKETGKWGISDEIIKSLYNYFNHEIAKAQQYRARVEIDNKVKLATADSEKDVKGAGEYFYYYEFLNAEVLLENKEDKELLKALYEKVNGVYRIKPNITLDNNQKDLIKAKIKNRFIDIVNETRDTWEKYGILERTEKGTLAPAIINSDYQSEINSKYKTKENNRTKIDLNAVTEHALVDYVFKNMSSNIELNIILGDPAQQSKIKVSKEPLTAQEVIAGIEKTFDNVGKRNARLVAQGNRGLWNEENYKVLIVNDMNVDASYIEQYNEAIQNMYKDLKNEKMTDAQEFTTVWEHLNDRYAHGEISKSEVLLGMMLYDPEHYEMLYNDKDSELNKYFKSKTRNKETGKIETTEVSQLRKLTDKEIKSLNSKALLQPRKPVQVFSKFENGIIQDYYIKTSSIPLVPSIIKNSPISNLRANMIANNISRTVFVSGVKIGQSEPVNLFNEKFEINEDAFKNPLTLKRSGYHIQLNVPYDESKDAIRQVTQALKLLFVDIPNNTILSSGRKVTDVKKEFKAVQDRLIEKSKKDFLESLLSEADILPDGNGNYVIRDATKLSKILLTEADKREFNENVKKMMRVNKDGTFVFPLIFNPSIDKIQPVLQALITNRIIRQRIPGQSYVQVSEVVTYKSFGKGKESIKTVEELTEKEKEGIIYVSPENKKGKLNFIKKGENGAASDRAQVYLPPFFTYNNKKIDVRQFVKDGYIDLERVPKEVLTLIGFRIPTEGRKSMMVFEVAGFLPEYMGNTVIVPSEIAIQMGSDYDVDKLYMYHYELDYYNDMFEGDWERYYEIKDAQDENYNALVNPEVKQKINEIKERIKELKEFKKEAESKEAKKAIQLELDELYATKDNIYSQIEALKTELEKGSEMLAEFREKMQMRLGKTLDSDINKYINIFEEVLLSSNNFDSVTTPQGFKNLQEEIDKIDQTNKVWLGSYNPNYQRNVFFDNKAGKTGVGVGANANTLHALAQEANLFIKNIGIKFKDENGNYYTDDVNTNRVNEYKKEMYPSADLEKNSAWRLDKILTFDGKLISEQITEWLAASVDNAKEKLLGKGGINDYNLGVSLTILQAGFSHEWALNFINQPILKEYYNILENIQSMFDTNFDSEKRTKEINNLIAKYAETDIENISSFNPDGYTLAEYKSMLNKSFEELKEDRKKQVSILLAFLQYDEITSDLNAVQSSMILDSKGLPKNYVETIQLRDKQITSLSDHSSIGNVKNLGRTVIGQYAKLPNFAIQLYSSIYDYFKPAYNQVVKNISITIGKEFNLSEDNTNDIYNGLFSYMYSHPYIQERIADGRNVQEYKEDLWNNLINRFSALKEKYPNNNLLRRITISRNNVLTLGNSFVKTKKLDSIISMSWLNMIDRNQKDPELRQFGLDLAAFTMYFNSNLYGVSNFFKYLPYEYFQALNLSDFLKANSKNLNDEKYLLEFEKQFLQHRPELAKSITNFISSKSKDIKDKKVQLRYVESPKKILKDIYVLAGSDAINRLVAKLDLNGNVESYLNFVSVYNYETKSYDLYEKVKQNEIGIHYQIVETLGSSVESIVDYKFGEKNQTNIDKTKRLIIGNKAPVAAPTTTPAVKSKSAIERVFKDGTGNFVKTPNDLLNNLLTSQNPAYVELAKFLKDRVNNYSISFGKIERGDGEHSYDEKIIKFDDKKLEKYLSIEKEKTKTKEDPIVKIERVSLHELFHGAVANLINDPAFKETEEYKYLERVYNRYVESFTEQEKKNLQIFKDYLDKKITTLPNEIAAEYNKYYAATDIVEFIPEVMTSEIVQRRLAVEESIIQKIVNKVLDIIKKALNIEKQSLLDDAVNSIMSVIEYNESLQTTPVSTNPAEYTNYSGGATGGDTVWAEIGKEYGLGKQVDYTPATLKKLTPEQLQEVETAYQKAVKDLGRNPLAADTFAGGLVRRDYLQAKAADAVYAVSTLIEPGQKDAKGYVNKTNKKIVSGGTGYAVQMAINLDKTVFVFNQADNTWWMYDNTRGEFGVYGATPILTKKFAGIGTREINEAGKQAIRDVYANTFKTTPATSETKETKNKSIEIANFESDKYNLNMSVGDYLKTLTKEQRDIFRELREQGIFKTDCK